MTAKVPARPGPDEFAPYYAGYIDRVPEGDIITILSDQLDDALALLKGLPEERGSYRYAPDKWSVKEVVGHVIDAERVFAYRALRFARGDRAPLAGFDQDEYVRGGDFDSRPVGELAEEFEHVRRSTVALFKSFGPRAWLQRGTANDVEVSVRALAYIIAGHARHHFEVIRSRYL